MQKKSDLRIRKQVDRLGRPSIDMLEREIARLEQRELAGRALRGFLVSLVATAAVIVLVTNLWVGVLQIESSGMSPLLQMDEIVIAIRGDNPKRNEIIAFTHDNQLYVRRVIAVSGDWVEISASGMVSVNGRVLDEPYVSQPGLGKCDIEFPFQVPPETVFVMGDNRISSTDSRDSSFGVINRRQIMGKVIFKLWPLTRIGVVGQ